MTTYRSHLPQLDGGLYLTDAGLETDLIFNKGMEIPEFATHTLLGTDSGQQALEAYFDHYLQLARERRTGIILDCPTWKAHRHWADALGDTPAGLEQANHHAVTFMNKIRLRYSGTTYPIVLNGLVGPKGDAYTPGTEISTNEAADYHAEQLGWLAETPHRHGNGHDTDAISGGCRDRQSGHRSWSSCRHIIHSGNRWCLTHRSTTG